MKNIRRFLTDFHRDERGVSAIEYAVLLLIPAFALIISLPVVGAGLDATFSDVTDVLGGDGIVSASVADGGGSSGDEASASDSDGEDGSGGGSCNRNSGHSSGGRHSSGGGWRWW